MIRLRSIGFCTAVFLAGAVASGQLLGEKNEIYLQLDAGYNTAYRESTWVPVDVTVRNQQKEVDGWIEIRTFDFTGSAQSPIYRVPAVCPKDSVKRFRLHCFLEHVDRVEAWLIEDGRAAVDVPAFLQPRPIESDDYLALVLDDEDTNFGFLFNSVQTADRQVRLHRHGVKTSDLSTLPNYPESFEAFDVIVMGEFDPGRVSARHRELIERYVLEGGMLVVTLGANTNAYRGSWVEPLLDAELGAIETVPEDVLAAGSFAPEQRAGVRPDRECVVTAITPKSGANRRFGGDTTLATLRRLGRGHVATIAVDAAGHALQGCAGYKDLWAQLLANGPKREHALRVDYVAAAAAQQLPALSGVSIRSRASVFTYLGLYIGVGVVGNWLFWNRLKRREMAWLCLFVFSIGFTAYAVVYGTSGWAKATELQQIEVVDVPLAGGSAAYHALTGILTARSMSFSGTLGDERMLVSDPGMGGVPNVYGGYDMAPRVPFRFVQESPPRFEDFRIGASELRMLHTQGRVDVSGGIEGSLTLDEGRLHGQLRNRTGTALGGAALLIDGNVIDLDGGDGRWSVDLAKQGDRADTDALWLSAYASDAATSPYYYYPYSVTDMTAFKAGLRRVLFLNDDFSFISPDQAPRLLAWSNSPVDIALRATGALPTKNLATLFVCEIDVVRNVRTTVPLALQLGTGDWTRPTGDTPDAVWQNTISESLYGRRSVDLTISVTDAMRRDPKSKLFATVYWSRGDDRVAIRPRTGAAGEQGTTRKNALSEPTTRHAQGFNYARYSFPDWRAYVNPRDERQVILRVSVEGAGGDQAIAAAEGTSRFVVSARGVATVRSTDDGDWPGWQ